MMKQSTFLVLFLFLFALVFAQKNISNNIENDVNLLEQQYIDAWKKIKRVDGFRIQIISFSGVNSKTSIENTAEQFKRQFPEIPCDISYFEPNFLLRVGRYHTKLEAYKALQKIVQFFPGAFVLKDQIDYK